MLSVTSCPRRMRLQMFFHFRSTGTKIAINISFPSSLVIVMIKYVTVSWNWLIVSLCLLSIAVRFTKLIMDLNSSESVANIRSRSKMRTDPNERGDEAAKPAEPPNNGSSYVSGDGWNIALLLFLYLLQGIPLGLSAAIPIILQNKKVSYKDQVSKL